ncbi:MAG: hypothetical protein ACXAEX_05070 [Promethearchaeota archaeon]|jgi:hypothetical protein
MKIKINFNESIGHSSLLYGDTNTSKTLLTAEFTKFLLESSKVKPDTISILDFAPELMSFNDLKIGGKIIDFYKNSKICRNILLKGEIIPPRLSSHNKTELYRNACENFKKTSEILHIFLDEPTPILIINDISIHLHIGGIKQLLEAIEKSNTFFGNSYYGSSIKRDFSSLFSLREKRMVEYLVKKVDKSYFTG